MNDLIVTSMNGIVVCHQGKSKMLAHGTYYGLTWDKSHIYCSFNPQHRNVTEIEVFDTASFARVGKLKANGLQGVHQIFSWDNELHVTNTSKDSIYVYSADDVCHFNWTGYMDDKRHINSIWIDNEWIYVAEGTTSYQDGCPAIQILTHQYKPANRIPLPAALQVHNVYVEDNMLYSLGKFGLVEKNLKKRNYRVTDLRTDKPNGFLRGLAKSADYFYIGESEIKSRDQRVYGDSKIMILDNEHNLKDTITLKDTGQIHDIRIINDVDLAHNGIILNYSQFKSCTNKNSLPVE